MKTDKNGFMTEDGMVAFYRDFGHLGDDVEVGGVSGQANGSRLSEKLQQGRTRFFYALAVNRSSTRPLRS